jgi:hypothetical protein
MPRSMRAAGRKLGLSQPTIARPPRLKAVAAALWGRPLKVELAKFRKTRSDI